MSMPENLRTLSAKYAARLMDDPLFSAKVKTVYRAMRIIAPDRDAYQVKAEAYILACVLEEMNV